MADIRIIGKTHISNYLIVPLKTEDHLEKPKEGVWYRKRAMVLRSEELHLSPRPAQKSRMTVINDLLSWRFCYFYNGHNNVYDATFLGRVR